jgi:hypothetical protein
MSSWENMSQQELNAAVQEASEVHMHTIVISPIMHDQAVFRGSDVGICGGYINPFPVFPWQLNNRKQAFVAGYRDMQKRIRNPKILDSTRSIEITEEVIRCGEDGDYGACAPVTVTKSVDSEETVQDLINFILYDSYAKDWKSGRFSMRIDGKFMANHEAPENCAMTSKEIATAVTLGILFVGCMLWHPVYFSAIVLCVLAVGAVWIVSYLVGVDRINRDLEKKHQQEEQESEGGTESCCSSSSGEEGEGVGLIIDEEEVILGGCDAAAGPVQWSSAHHSTCYPPSGSAAVSVTDSHRVLRSHSHNKQKRL